MQEQQVVLMAEPCLQPLVVFFLKRVFCLFCSLVAIPVYVKHSISFRDSSSLGRFEITVGPKQTLGKTIEGVIVTSQMPKGVLNMSLTPSQGTHTFDPVTKVGDWARESPSTQAAHGGRRVFLTQGSLWSPLLPSEAADSMEGGQMPRGCSSERG